VTEAMMAERASGEVVLVVAEDRGWPQDANLRSGRENEDMTGELRTTWP
jgi:hypothetical protein